MKYYFLLFLLFISCKTTNQIEVYSKPSKNEEVIAWYDRDKKEIWGLSFPIILTLENKSSAEEEFVSYKYIYKNSSKGSPALLYFKDKNTLKRLQNYSKKNIKPKSKSIYTIYSRHLIRNTGYSNKIIPAYQNKKFNNDSISLGSFENFKIKFPVLTEKLLIGDSLFIKFKNQDKSKKLYTKRIKMPVEL